MGNAPEKGPNAFERGLLRCFSAADARFLSAGLKQSRQLQFVLNALVRKPDCAADTLETHFAAAVTVQ